MTNAAPTAQPYDEAKSESIERSGDEFQFASTPALKAVTNRSRSSFGTGLETQLELLSYMRNRSAHEVAPAATVKTLALVWRLMAVTGASVGILTAGVLLTAVAFSSGSIAPDPFVALSVLSVGLVLLATVVKVVRGDGPRD
jgi:hypothetical protein